VLDGKKKKNLLTEAEGHEALNAELGGQRRMNPKQKFPKNKRRGKGETPLSSGVFGS